MLRVRLLACVAVAVAVCVVGASSFAAPAGQGGYIYCSKMIDPTTYATRHYDIIRIEVDQNFQVVGGPVIVDNVYFSANNTYNFSAAMYQGSSLEIYDPRDQGGTGRVMLPVIANDSPTPTSSQYQAWDIVLDCLTTKTHTLLCDGTNYTNTSTWHTVGLSRVLVAPQNWLPGTQSNGISLVTDTFMSGYPNYQALQYLHDQGGAAGQIDTASSDGQVLAWEGATGAPLREHYVGDMEFAGNTLYVSSGGRAGGSNDINRIWVDGAGVVHDQLFYRSGYAVGSGANPIWNVRMITNGLAVSKTNPIVYLFAWDNVLNPTSGLYSQTPSVFALEDKNGDNQVVLADGDSITRIFRGGDYGLTFSAGYGVGDIEFYLDPESGKTVLIGTGILGLGTGQTRTFLLELADNGVAVMSGSTLYLGTAGPGIVGGTYGSFGIELDMNYYDAPAVPEPTTLLLLGTGALGVLGYIRRRRMN